MAQKSTLTNTGTAVYNEVVDGDHYTIEPGESITVPRRKAVAIRGQYCGTRKVTLVMKHIGDASDAQYVCQLDGMEFQDKASLDAHLEILRGKTTEGDTGKVYVAPDGKEFKSKAGLMSYLRSLDKKGEGNDSSADTGNS